jgi:nucleotide-binding universal stress UspA family protein
MLRSAMVPVDFSSDSETVLRFSEGLSALGIRRVVLGHAVDAAGMEGPVIAKSVDTARDKVRALQTGLVDAGLEVEVRVATGDVTDTLLSIASESHVDLVVAGTHGKGVLNKLIQGSVSEDIVQSSQVPTMMVRYDLLRAASHPRDVAEGFGRSVLLPTDFSSSSMRALLSVFEMPSKSVGTLYLLHVIEERLSGEKARKAEEGAEFQLRNMVSMAAEHGVSARPVIKKGDAKRTIMQEANERRVSGMVVGSRGANPLQEVMLGSVSLTLMRQASCPVIIVP